MRKALIVGIDDYPKLRLYSCINDATRIARLLETNGDGTRNFEIRLETTIFTKSVLRTKLIELFKGSCELALFYFSGHGCINELGGYMMTRDWVPYDEGISMDEVLKLANNSKATNKIIIIDSCHAGVMGSPSLLGMSPSFINDGVTILAASRADESAMARGGTSVFTDLLVEALEGGAADIRGQITPSSIYAFVDQALGAFDQRPIFKTNTSRFTPIRTVNPQIPIEVLKKITQYFPNQDDEHSLDPSYEDSNSPLVKPLLKPPYAMEKNVAAFKHLQNLQSVGLVVPVDESFMYFAAMNSKSCKLTALGRHYWSLAKDKRL